MKEKKAVEMYLKKAMAVQPTDQVWDEIKNAPITIKETARKKQTKYIWYPVATAACLIFVFATMMITKNDTRNLINVYPNSNINETTEFQTVTDNIIVNQTQLIERAKINGETQKVSFEELQNAINSDLSAYSDLDVYEYSLIFDPKTQKVIGANINDKTAEINISISINGNFEYDIIIDNTVSSLINNVDVEIYNSEKLFLALYKDKENIIYIESSSLDQEQFISYLNAVIN